MDPPKGIALRPPGEAHRIFAFLTDFEGGGPENQIEVAIIGI